MFHVMGKKICRVGEVGAGEAMKLTNAAMAHCSRLVYIEALQIAEAYGISEKTVNDVVTTSTGMSFSQKNHDRPDNHIKNHTLRHSPEMPSRFSKDLRYATSVGLKKLLSTPIIALGSQLAPDVYAKRWQRILDQSSAAETRSAKPVSQKEKA